MRDQKKRIVIAPDSFKGTMTAIEVCRIIRKAFLQVDSALEICCLPMADGGEGTVDAFLSALGGERKTVRVHGPLFAMHNASFGILKDGTAILEMAAAAGLPLAGKDANPMYTTTFGVGELIRAALDAGCRKIRVGAGGSATTDGGIGCLTALGARFTDKTGEEVPPMGCGLRRVACINLDGLDERLREADVTVLCDVKSPLYGAQGAAFVFAPQKGALPKQVQTLDNALRAFAQTLLRYTGSDIRSLVGAGAAGGLAGGLCAMLGAHLAGGVETLLCEVGFDALALRSSLVVTGEGRIDEQSMQGKVPWGVAKHAPHTPVIAIAGGVQGDRSTLACQMGLVRIYEANYRQRPPHEIGRYCREDLEYIAVRAAKEFLQDCKASAD